ncbi:hypothetical protein MD484_g4035, partial [Candolleomyces efflorescens]
MGKIVTLRNAERQSTILDGCDSSMEGTEPPVDAPQALLNKLPIELLVEIFWFYVHGADICSIPSHAFQIPTSLQSSGDPIRLTHICSLWRAISLSTPTLWSTIYINPSLSKHHFACLSHHIKYAGSAPLTLTLEIKGLRRSDPSERISIENTLRYALGHLHRCRRVYLNPSWELQGCLVRNLPSTPPMHLEEFNAHIPGFSAANTLKLSAYLHASPKLCSAKWKGVHAAFGKTTERLVDDIPRNTIRAVELGDFHAFDDLVPFLGGCELLERVGCYVSQSPSGGGSSGGVQGTPLRLAHLRSLSLSTMGDLTSTLSSLTLPLLTELTLDHFWDMGHAGLGHVDIGWDALLGLVERSRCKIQKFIYKRNGGNSVDDPYVSEDAMMRALASPFFNELHHLSLEGRFGNTTLYGLLAPQRILPALKNLEIKGCWSTDGVWSDLVMRRHPSLGGRYRGVLESAKILLRGPSQSNFCRDRMLVVPGVDVHVEWKEFDDKSDWVLYDR